jgi:hypothetical protein
MPHKRPFFNLSGHPGCGMIARTVVLFTDLWSSRAEFTPSCADATRGGATACGGAIYKRTFQQLRTHELQGPNSPIPVRTPPAVEQPPAAEQFTSELFSVRTPPAVEQLSKRSLLELFAFKLQEPNSPIPVRTHPVRKHKSLALPAVRFLCIIEFMKLNGGGFGFLYNV